MKRPGNNLKTYALLYRLSARELLRNKFGLILLFAIPTVFLLIVEYTSGTGQMVIKLFFFKTTESILLGCREISIIFMGAAVSGFLTAYYAILLFHENIDYFRYCISMGLKPGTFLWARFSFFLTIVIVLALFITLIVRLMTPVSHLFFALTGFIMLGIIYGAYGGIVGIISKDFMVAILMIVLLANVDAGWLQNPAFYTYAQESAFIKSLPAFFPCQFTFSSVFTGKFNAWALLMSVAYAAGLLLVLYVLVQLKMRRLYHIKNMDMAGNKRAARGRQ